jgi:hypothetical protein
VRAVDGDAMLVRQHAAMAQAAQAMPMHADYIRRHCAAQG